MKNFLSERVMFLILLYKFDMFVFIKKDKLKSFYGIKIAFSTEVSSTRS